MQLTVENKTYSVQIDNSLTDFDRKMLLYCYQPIIGLNACNIYTTLYSNVNTGSNESSILNHNMLLKIMGLSCLEFIEERKKLEALGLLDSYFLDNHYIYVLKRVLTPYEFFNDEALNAIFFNVLGESSGNDIMYELMLRRLDPLKFNRITSSFDEVFDIEVKPLSPSEFIDTTNHGITIRKEAFDFNYFLVLIEALDILDANILNSIEFIDKVNRYAFLFTLNVEEMKDAVIMAVNTDKTIDDDKFIKAVKYKHDSRKVKTIVAKRSPQLKSNDKLIDYLEKSSPSDIVKAKTNTNLTSGEIEMFNKLLVETQQTIGVINVLLIYVLEEKNGDIPAYNYFLKVLNTWIRAGVHDAKSALEYINRSKIPNTNLKQRTKKQEKSKPSWYNEYQNNQDSLNNNDKSRENTLSTNNNDTNINNVEEKNDMSLDDISNYFKIRKK